MTKSSRIPGKFLACAFAFILAGCSTSPAKPTDAALSCRQMDEEIASQFQTRNQSERRAGELRGGYYAWQAATFIPFVGEAMSVADLVTDVSGGRELDHLNEDARSARQRGEYLHTLRTARCPPDNPPA